jgi:integrase
MRQTPGAANRVLALLSKMFHLAEAWGLRPVHTNPVIHIEKYPERNREVYLDGAQLSRLGEVLRQAAREKTANPSTLACLWLLIYTGARVGEVLTLRWEYLDWSRGVAHLPDSKSGAKPLFVPPPALDLLRSLPRALTSPWCLPGRRPGQHLASPYRSWYRLRREAGLPAVRLHDLRHTWVSTGLAMGLSLDLIGRAIGHTDLRSTAGYAHIGIDPLSVVAASVAAQLQHALGED